MTDIFGRVFGVILAFILLFIAPFTMVTLSQEMVARRTILNEMQSFIDETIDSRQVTDQQLEDFYLGISGLGPIVDVEISRYVRTVDPDPVDVEISRYVRTVGPDPVEEGEIYVTYVYSEDNRTYNQGDKVSVRVHAIGYTGTQKFLRAITGLFLPQIDYTLAGRVR